MQLMTMLFFLGAGASSPFGIPTMPGFIELLDREVTDSQIYSEIRKASREDFDLETLMTIVEDLTKPPQNFFSTISPQTAHFLLQKEREQANQYLTEDSRKEAIQLLSRIKAIIRKECIKAASQDSKIIEVYDNFFNSLGQTREQMNQGILWEAFQLEQSKMTFPSNLKIFTTNYDTCIEVYFNRKETDFSRGIVKRYGEDIFDVDSYNSQPQGEIQIYKLHGSVDLFQKKGKIRQLSTAGTADSKTFLGKECGEESMRWPIEFGGYRHVIESPYLDLFRKLREAAKEKKWWIIIGFSFRDRTICSLLDDVLRLKPLRDRPRVFLIDKHPELILQRLSEWGYTALAETICPIQVEFENKNMSKKFFETFVEKGIIKEMQVSRGKIRY